MSFSNNLKYLRKNRKPKVTQSEMADLLGISVSTYGSYEEGRAEPKLDNLRKLASFFSVSMEQLLHAHLNRDEGTGDFSQLNSYKSGAEVLVATVDSSGKDNIEWVSAKAAAGYTTGYADLEFVQELPVFQVPFLDSRKKYRVFTIQGDSMLPVPSGSMIFAEYIDDWTQVKDDSLCIVVTQSEGIVFKKVINYLKKQNCLLLISTNLFYKPFLVAASDVVEVWKFVGFFSNQFPETPL